MDGWMDGWMDGCMHGCMDAWTSVAVIAEINVMTKTVHIHIQQSHIMEPTILTQNYISLKLSSSG